MLDYCIQKASELPFKRGRKRHYCIITDKRGRILAEASNSYIKTSPKMLKASKAVGLDEKIYWHAECKAIYSLRNKSRAYRIMVARVDSSGLPVNSKPCCICMNLIKQMGIKTIEYTV